MLVHNYICCGLNLIIFNETVKVQRFHWLGFRNGKKCEKPIATDPSILM